MNAKDTPNCQFVYHLNQNYCHKELLFEFYRINQGEDLMTKRSVLCQSTTRRSASPPRLYGGIPKHQQSPEDLLCETEHAPLKCSR